MTQHKNAKLKGIMIQGTSSDAGKSYVATALCRVLSNRGINVAPFKSQNMSNNSYVTLYGEEIGRAQGAQALAARVEPSVYMNPILLKPKNNALSEIVLFGHPLRDATSKALFREFLRREGAQAIDKAKEWLTHHYEAVVIEGAGSPVEINLNDREIVNMYVARAFDVPVILVADIDRGGVFAQIVGTLELLEPEDRKRVGGIIINKFRGDIDLFEDGKRWLETYTGVPVLGVLPYLDIPVENEDRLSLEFKPRHEADLIIGVLDLPYISNATDLEVFEVEPDVAIQKVRNRSDLWQCDALIIPGTKSTQEDLMRFMELGFDADLQTYAKEKPVFGICGGYQMMGEILVDPQGMDSDGIGEMKGFGLFKGVTTFVSDKRVTKCSAVTIKSGTPIEGFEIHLGRTEILEPAQPLLRIGDASDGVDLGNVKGTYVHHIFHNDVYRNEWLNEIRMMKGLLPKAPEISVNRYEDAFEDLARAFEKHVDMDAIMEMIR